MDANTPPSSGRKQSHLNDATRTGVYIHFLICTFLMVTHGRRGLGMFGAYLLWSRPKPRLRSRVGLRAANLRVHVIRHHTLVRVQHDRVTAQQANLPYTWEEPGGSDCLLRRGPNLGYQDYCPGTTTCVSLLKLIDPSEFPGRTLLSDAHLPSLIEPSSLSRRGVSLFKLLPLMTESSKVHRRHVTGRGPGPVGSECTIFLSNFSIESSTFSTRPLFPFW
ncbi:hypothetical protein EDD15DRAFT_867665 [Pisolithus albus]|nr:hypothetical protein EDD15DRAFT_867665 [Pisolithus albus]